MNQTKKREADDPISKSEERQARLYEQISNNFESPFLIYGRCGSSKSSIILQAAERISKEQNSKFFLHSILPDSLDYEEFYGTSTTTDRQGNNNYIWKMGVLEQLVWAIKNNFFHSNFLKKVDSGVRLKSFSFLSEQANKNNLAFFFSYYDWIIFDLENKSSFYQSDALEKILRILKDREMIVGNGHACRINEKNKLLLKVNECQFKINKDQNKKITSKI